MVSVIAKIVRIKHAVKRWRSKSLGRRKASGDSSSDSEDPSVNRRRIPHGFVAVYVGPERFRFVIPIRFLKFPVFSALLNQAAEEYGFHGGGGLTLPCEARFFGDVLRLLGEDEEKFRSLGLGEFSRKISELDLESSLTPLLPNARV